MPLVALGDAHIHYTEHGDPSGPPVLLIAPGGLRSSAAFWARSPWDPQERLPSYRVIAMDQRNAGQSRGSLGEGWSTYTSDQLALLDHLAIEQCSVVGMCIGGPYIVRLCRAAPARIRSAVMFQPIGVHENRARFFDLFEGWRKEIGDHHPDVEEDAWIAFRDAMFAGEFLFGASKEDARAVSAPILLLYGDDPYHPRPVSEELAKLLPNVQTIERWKSGADLATAHDAILAFLAQHHG